MCDLQDMLREPALSRTPALFISTGSALFDNLTIDYLLTGPWVNRISRDSVEKDPL